MDGQFLHGRQSFVCRRRLTLHPLGEHPWQAQICVHLRCPQICQGRTNTFYTWNNTTVVHSSGLLPCPNFEKLCAQSTTIRTSIDIVNGNVRWSPAGFCASFAQASAALGRRTSLFRALELVRTRANPRIARIRICWSENNSDAIYRLELPFPDTNRYVFECEAFFSSSKPRRKISQTRNLHIFTNQ